MSKKFDLKKVDAALKQTAKTAVSGTRVEALGPAAGQRWNRECRDKIAKARVINAPGARSASPLPGGVPAPVHAAQAAEWRRALCLGLVDPMWLAAAAKDGDRRRRPGSARRSGTVSEKRLRVSTSASGEFNCASRGRRTVQDAQHVEERREKKGPSRRRRGRCRKIRSDLNRKRLPASFEIETA